jgi:anti-sigma regulatory factor (Ser/Thr protein kinase)
MVAIKLSSFEDVRVARDWVGSLAEAAGIRDPDAAVQTTAELGNNCIEHANESPGLLWVSCRPGRLSLRFENRCERRPDWQTRKPAVVEQFRTGGYGLQIARALARSVNCRWKNGRVIVAAEFE